ncbi:hypothetical protein [Oceanobacillus salinisoli]|uniref:hypothetical protein n=1 Tax=Oceanobacillus salinisoli TaxID=2678611 RepID=UPI0012E2D84A|nr:hypothetical protein [Oceanobacillus salinisoli]
MSFFIEAYRQSPILSVTAWIHAILFMAFCILMIVDERQLLGVNVWNKPAKFAISIFVYTITIAYIVGYVKSIRMKRLIEVGTSIAMTMEILLIGMQAGRGVRSHFNLSSVFNSLVFSLMGIFIMIATLAALLLVFYLTFHPPKELPDYLFRSIQFGLWISILGSIVGGYMAAQLQHTVGAADGGPGLPILNWSIEYGDMRIPHFVGLHALQVIPLLALGMGKLVKQPAARIWLTWGFIVGYILLLIIVFSIAYTGNPIIILLGIG